MQVKVFNYSSRNPETVRRFAQTAALHIVCAFESKLHHMLVPLQCRPANYYRWMAPETFIDNVFDNKSDV